MRAKDQAIFLNALDELEKEKGLSKEDLLVAIENAMLVAYKKNYKDAENAFVSINRKNGDVKIFANKEVVEVVKNPTTEVELLEAKIYNKKAKIGDIVEVEVKAEMFKRNAIQNAKQIVIQKVREHEKQNFFNKFKKMEDSLVSALVKKMDENGNLYVEINGMDAIVQGKFLSPNDKFVQGDIVTLYIGTVEEGSKYTKIEFSRNSERFVEKLIEREVPEIANGDIEIKSIAREAGLRTKVAIFSSDENLDIKGACMGPNRIRLESILANMPGEKIDLIEWDEDTRVYVGNALAPAQVFSSEIIQEKDEIIALVGVDEMQLSLAIGKKGHNSRLASKLCKIKIEIKGLTQEEQESMLGEIEEIEESN